MAFGVPPLLNSVNNAINTAILLASDALAVINFFSARKVTWGIFLGNTQVVVPDSIISLEYKRDYRIADYPMEQGAFESYNKVKIPYDLHIRMTKGGTVADRSAFLVAISGMADSLSLYSVRTPEGYYPNLNVQHVDYKREALHGVGLITVDVWLVEIRQAAVPSFTNTAAPSGSDPAAVGTVQPAPTPKAQVQAITSRGATGSW